MSDTLLDVFVKSVEVDLRAEIKKQSDALTSGVAADFADYKRRVGLINGYQGAMEIYRARLKKLLNEDDDGQ